MRAQFLQILKQAAVQGRADHRVLKNSGALFDRRFLGQSQGQHIVGLGLIGGRCTLLLQEHGIKKAFGFEREAAAQLDARLRQNGGLGRRSGLPAGHGAEGSQRLVPVSQPLLAEAQAEKKQARPRPLGLGEQSLIMGQGLIKPLFAEQFIAAAKVYRRRRPRRFRGLVNFVKIRGFRAFRRWCQYLTWDNAEQTAEAILKASE